MAKTTKHYKLLIDVLENNRTSQMTGVTPRNSDTEMLIQILQFSGANMSAEQLTLIREFNFESLTRARRKLQNGGEYLPSPEVAKRRRIKGWELMQVAPKETAAGLQRRIERNV